MRLILFALSTLFLMCGCTGGTWRPGYIITSDGEMLSNTDENMRAVTLGNIVRDLDAQLGGHWRVEAAIAELPTYSGSDDTRDSGWMWAKATTSITLIGDGAGEPPLSEGQINGMVRDYLWSKVERPHRNLIVTTTRVVDAARFAARPVKPGAAEKAAAPAKTDPPSTTPRRYTAQAGDTWADLSQAFYGSTQHWRLIADANQGGDLTAGREIVIPPKP